MTEIIVNNSICRVNNLPKEAEKEIKFHLRYLSQSVAYVYNQNVKEINYLNSLLNNKRFTSNNAHIKNQLISLEKQNAHLRYKMYVSLYKKGEFPTGLLPKVEELLINAKVDYKLIDERVRPQRNKIKYVLKESLPPLRYYQRTGARLAVEKGRGIIVAPTGSGKSLLITRMIWEIGVKTLVITPSKAITDNMMDTLTKYFGKGKVGKLNTKSVITKDINVCNIQALIKIDPKVLEDIDAVFIDEFHRSAADTYQKVNNDHLRKCFYRVGVTATNFRNDGADMALEGILSEVLYEYTIEQALKDGFLVKPEFRVIDIEAEPHNLYQTEYRKSIVENDLRNTTIASIAQEHHNNSVLILVQQVEHGELLKNMLHGSEFIHGEEKDAIRQQIMEDFRKGKIKCLVGTIGVMGEGVDLPIADVLIMACSGKAKGQIMQAVGRVLRPYKEKSRAIVYDFTDKGSKHLSEHALLRQEVYKQYETK